MNYAKSYIDNYRKYAAAVAAEKAARAALANEFDTHAITKATFDAKLAAILENAPKEIEYSANCLASDKFCQKFIDMVDVLDGRELLTDTVEE